MEEASATAEGDLARTPLAHLLVYALDRRLSGVIFLTAPGGVEHVIRLARGAPVKVKPGDRFALLGEMLVEAGLADQKTIDHALATKGLLGDMLLLAGRVERDALEKVAEQQFLRRMVRLFALPPETTYRYFEGHGALAEYGGDPASCDPLAVLWAGLREHGEASTMMEGTLARIGEAGLKLHPSATAPRFRFDPREGELYEAIASRGAPLAELCALGCAPPEIARRLAYALAITRQLELGVPGLPVGIETTASALRRVVATPAQGGTAVARMSLKSTVHRVGAAAPDLPGDGERTGTMVVASRRPRERAGSIADSAPPSSSRVDLIPPSSSQRDVLPASSQRDVRDTPPVSSQKSAADAIPSVLPDSLDRPSDPTQRSVADRAPPSSGIIEIAPAAPAQPEPPLRPAALSAPRPDGSAEITLRSHTAPTMEELRAAFAASALPDAPVISAAPDVEVSAEALDVDADAIIEEEAEPFAGKSPAELLAIAARRLAERDAQGAVDACDAGRREAPGDPDLVALSAWARSQLSRADVKALAIELDELLRAHEDHVAARYYRAMLRKRLGDEAAAMRDLCRVLELSPDHADAQRELGALNARPKRPDQPESADARSKPKERPSLFGKLFKR